MPVSSWSTSCVLRAMRAENCVGSPSASSKAFVWSDCVQKKKSANKRMSKQKNKGNTKKCAHTAYLRPAHDGGHRLVLGRRRGVGHRNRAVAHEVEGALAVERAGGVERGDLAQAVPRGEVGLG